MRLPGARAALAALGLALAAGAAAAESAPATGASDWPFPGGGATYVAARLGPVIPRGSFASGVYGVAGEVAGGAWWHERVGVELAMNVSWTSGRRAGAPSVEDTLLGYGVGASLKVAPWRLRAPYLLAGLGRYAFTFEERPDAAPRQSVDGHYLAPHAGVGYLHRVARSAVALAEVRWVRARADVVGGSRDLSTIAVAIGLAYP